MVVLLYEHSVYAWLLARLSVLRDCCSREGAVNVVFREVVLVEFSDQTWSSVYFLVSIKLLCHDGNVNTDVEVLISVHSQIGVACSNDDRTYCRSISFIDVPSTFDGLNSLC